MRPPSIARLDLVEQTPCIRLKPVVLLRGAGTFTNPAGDSDWLSTSATGEQTHFDSSGKQTWLVSADGLSTTTFTYSCGDLSGIQTPDGALTTSMLSSGEVQTILITSRTRSECSGNRIRAGGKIGSRSPQFRRRR